MKLVAAANGGNDVELPWSGGISDEHIAQLKLKEFTSSNSKFYNQIGAYRNEVMMT
jgi:hypothetical protein